MKNDSIIDPDWSCMQKFRRFTSWRCWWALGVPVYVGCGSECAIYGCLVFSHRRWCAIGMHSAESVFNFVLSDELARNLRQVIEYVFGKCLAQSGPCGHSLPQLIRRILSHSYDLRTQEPTSIEAWSKLSQLCYFNPIDAKTDFDTFTFGKTTYASQNSKWWSYRYIS